MGNLIRMLFSGRAVIVLMIVLGISVHSAASKMPGSQAEREQQVVQALYEHVLKPDSEALVSAARAFQVYLAEFQAHPDAARLEAMRTAFVLMVVNWKVVEAGYLAGDFDPELLDLPRYIDTFHQGKEDLGKQLQRIIAANSDLSKALYKNSFKTLNALEYVLFSAQNPAQQLQALQENNARRLHMASFILAGLTVHFEKIAQYYQSPQTLLQDPENTLSILVNRLINNAYQLANWQVGEPGGFNKKFAGNPDFSRLAFHYSHSSAAVIRATIALQKRIFDAEHYPDLLELAAPASENMLYLQRQLNKVVEIVAMLPDEPALLIADPQLRKTFVEIERLQQGYYFLLQDSLGIKPKILDADGD